MSGKWEEFMGELRADWNASGTATTPFYEKGALLERVAEWLFLRNLPKLSIASYLLALFTFNMLIQLMRFTFWQVIAQLAIVEAPQISFRDNRERNTGNGNDDAPTLVAEERTYTTSLRRILRHLYRAGGPLAFWRGFAIFFVCSFASGLAMVWFHSFFVAIRIGQSGEHTSIPNHIFNDLLSDVEFTLAQIAVAPLATAFVHIVITAPTFRVWTRRVPPIRTTFARVVPAIVAYSLAKSLTFTVPHLLRHILLKHEVDPKGLAKVGLTKVVSTITHTLTTDGTPTTALSTITTTIKRSALSSTASATASTVAAFTTAASQTTPSPAKTTSVFELTTGHTAPQKFFSFIIWLVAQTSRILALIPAGFALVRVQAALLPEDEEPIVPLDRSFGSSGPGAAAPGILRGSSPPFRLRAAWRSYGNADQRRLLWLYAEMAAVELVVRGVFGLILGLDAVEAGEGWNPQTF